MTPQTFREYLKSTYNSSTSRAAASYLKAIEIIDKIFLEKDVFKMHGQSIADLRDPVLLAQIIEYIDEEERRYKNNEASFFDLINPKQTSYPRKGFCSNGIKRLGDYVNQKCRADIKQIMQTSRPNGEKLSKHLFKKFNFKKKGTDKEIRAQRRVGQEFFRAMLLEIYNSKCCLTGIEIPEVLRASHIIPWSKREEERLNPENGLCLSATYDAAFDRHLITFDEDYRLILSPVLKEEYTSDAFKTYFLSIEGKRIYVPSIYKPSQKFLSEHREKLIV